MSNQVSTAQVLVSCSGFKARCRDLGHGKQAGSVQQGAAGGPGFSHQKGIVHRDVKPENILLQDNGHIALCDFGISKDTVHGLYESTVDLTAAGTLAYSAPEAGMVLETHATSLQVELMLCSFFCMSFAV